MNQEDKMYNNVYVRRNIASNAADTPVEVLSALAQDADTDARASLADPDH